LTDATPVKCRACDRTVRFDQVKYDDARKAYVCQNCFKDSHKVSMKQVLQKPGAKKEEPKASTSKNDKVKYICVKCKYSFERAKDKSASSCPYCGASDIQLVSNQAHKLIEDSNGFDY
jgi:DNA-directed RNA polymerase subunit RPC12/RpoP